MPPDLVVHGFETSNNMKVRVALGYKRVAYAFRTVDPADRAEIQRISGQSTTPVLVHGDVVLCDSAAILRYLECNFPDTPRLFGGSLGEQWEIEDWELFARTTLAGPMLSVVHNRVLGHPLDDDAVARCADDFAAAAGRLAARLDGRDWLVGEALTAADVTAAAVLLRVRNAGLFELPAGAEHLVAWVDRVMAYDGVARED